MKMAPHPALANGKACHVGDPVAVVIAETLAQARDAAEKVKIDYEVLPAVADPAAAQKHGAPQIHDVAPNNTIYQWHLGEPKASRRRVQIGQARHQARHRQQPPGAERDGAARRDRRIRCGQPATSRCGIRRRIRMSRGSSSRPSSAWRRSTSCASSRPMSAAVSARRSFIYPEEVVALWASQKRRPAGEMDLRPLRGVSCRRSWPRPRHPCRNGVRRRGQDHRPARQNHRQSRRLHVDLLVGGADLPLCDAAVGPVRHPADLLRGRCGLHQHRAGRRLSRRRAPGGDLRCRAADRGRRARTRPRSGRAAPEELRQIVPASDAGDHGL